MEIVDFSGSPILSASRASAQAVAAWFIPSQSASGQRIVPTAAQEATRQLALPFAPDAISEKTRAKISGPSRLKVVREFDLAISPACAGRMVISGRMADVCAELDAWVQHETVAQ